MRRATLAAAAVVAAWSSLPGAAQNGPGAVDFDRDVKPILREKCTGCHGGNQPQAGLRLDARRPALIGSTAHGVVIVPGNSDRSLLFWRVSSAKYGPQMPPTGALAADQIDTLKHWIDQGAPWPEAERAAHAVDPRVADVAGLFRAGTATAAARAGIDAALLNASGPDGMTPLMYAALYGTPADVVDLLGRGANPNAQNDAGTTALMLAAMDGAKVRALLAKGANPNLRSENGRTALHVAAQRGAIDVVRLLLAANANVSFTTGDSPLALAAATGNVDLVHLLVEAGAPATRQAGVGALANAAIMDCALCIDVVAAEAEPVALGVALDAAANAGSLATMKALLDRGAPVEAHDMFGGGTALMMATISDRDAVAKVKLLLERGADVHAKSELGDTALDFATRRGDPALMAILGGSAAPGGAAGAEGVKDGAAPVRTTASTSTPADAAVRGAVEKALPLLQQTDVRFTKNTGCISCHHEILPEMAVYMASRRKLKTDAEADARQFGTLVSYLDDRRPRALEGLDIAGGQDTLSYLLFGLDVRGYAPTETTDAWARYLMMMQLPEGRWRIQINRPPIESNDIEVTAMSLRALSRYAPAAERAFYDQRVRAAGAWLAHEKAASGEERAFRLLGLHWAGAPAAATAEAVKDLRSAQRPDGGWAQLDTRGSDAYATGQALYALHEAGGMATTDPVYRRGVRFLLDTQEPDGSWLVRSRTVALQPQFESGFPHGRDQWISSAGTSWAVIALLESIP
jgi:ankyrin repeat protein